MILLFSGGIDSFVAYHYLNKPQTVYFDLGTPYTHRELRVIKKLIPDTIIDNTLNLNSRQVGSKAYIPFRNLYLAMLAVKYDQEICIAGVKDDVVSDKNEFIFKEFSRLLSIMNPGILVFSPFWLMSKAEVVKWFIKNVGKPELLLDTISCYSSTEVSNYCGACPSCFRKWTVLRSHGVDIEFVDRILMLNYYQAAKKGQYLPERNVAIIREVDAYLT